MAHIGLKYVKFDALTNKQKQELKDALQQQKRDLQTAIRATDTRLSFTCAGGASRSALASGEVAQNPPPNVLLNVTSAT